jgi:hypothetical protein
MKIIWTKEASSYIVNESHMIDIHVFCSPENPSKGKVSGLMVSGSTRLNRNTSMQVKITICIFSCTREKNHLVFPGFLVLKVRLEVMHSL